MIEEDLQSNMKRPMFKKFSKSTKYYLLCGGLAVILIIGLLILYAYLTGFDIAAMFVSKYAFIAYGAILIYIAVGIPLIVKDKIGRM